VGIAMKKMGFTVPPLSAFFKTSSKLSKATIWFFRRLKVFILQKFRRCAPFATKATGKG
jgi:hypothetical protein